MKRKNYFEILGLCFDPPEGNTRKIDKAIEAWEASITNALANASGDKKTEFEAEYSLKNDMEKCMKTPKTRNEEAKKLKEEKINQLQKLIDIMRIEYSGTPEVTNAQIRNVCMKLLLQDSTVKKIYESNGFVIQKKDDTINLKEYFLTTTIFNDIASKIERLSQMKIAKMPWTADVSDLYDFACFCSGGTQNDCPGFHKKKTKDLLSVLEALESTYATDNSESGHLMADLIAKGKSQVFKDELSRKKYDHSMRRNHLNAFFALLRTAPEVFKRDPLFADSCIRTIEKEIPDYNIALALYNEEAGIKNDPYEPLEAFVHVTCGICGTSNKFRSQEEAKKSKCNTCGGSLYLKCPKCEKLVPVSSDRCSCGFLLSEMRFFEEYVKETEFALQEMDIYEAKRKFAKAENANPKSKKIVLLRNRVKEMSDLYEEYVRVLDDLISAQKYFEANKYIAKVTIEMPKLNIDSQKKVVKNKMDMALQKMPDKNDPNAADKCVDIIREIKDYQPAIEMLRTFRPKAPESINVSVAGNSKLKCTINWLSTKEKGITYTVVRKNNEPSKYHTDGQVIAKDITVLEITDTSIEPGVCYYYTVFSCREGVYSVGISKEVAYYAEIEESTLRIAAESGVCRINWVLPKNATGVRILRRENAMPSNMPDADTTIIAESAVASYTDTNVKNGTRYFYRLLCLYSVGTGFTCSKNGVAFSLTPEEPPAILRSITSKVKNTTVLIQWEKFTERKFETEIREISNHLEKSVVGVVMSTSDLNMLLGKGKNFSCVTSDLGHCSFDIPLNSTYQIAVITSSGSSSVVSAVLNISSIEKCEINRKESRIETGRLLLKLSELPKKLSRIHYMMAVKKGKEVPWASKNDAINHTMKIISIEDYQRDGMIVIEPIPQDDIYVSVIGEYTVSGEEIIYSETSKLKLSNKPKSIIKYSLAWIKSGLFGNKIKACKWIIETSAEEIPELWLVYKTDGHIPMRLEDPKVILLQKINEREEAFPGNKMEIKLEENILEKLPMNAEIRMMLLPEDRAEYEIVCDDLKTLRVPS